MRPRNVREHLKFCTWRRQSNAFGIKIIYKERYSGNNLWLPLRLHSLAHTDDNEGSEALRSTAAAAAEHPKTYK